jgi:ssRNA-specific RNase YbeY (16S rRNA maturation enzyme)
MEIYLKNRQKTTSLNLKRLEKDLSKALLHLSLQSSELSVLFVNSRRMRLLNTRYRGIPRDTDALLSSDGERSASRSVVLRDIVVSTRALQQAEEFRVPFMMNS